MTTEWEAKYTELETRFSEFKVKLAVERAANKLKFAHPQDALALVDFSDLTIDDEGNVTGGFEKQLEALAESGRLAMQTHSSQPGLPGRQDKRQRDVGTKKPDAVIVALANKHRI